MTLISLIAVGLELNLLNQNMQWSKPNQTARCNTFWLNSTNSCNSFAYELSIRFLLHISS